MRAEIGVENAVIGAVLLEAECLSEVLGIVSLDDFGEPMARRCFAAMLRLHESGRLLDPMAVAAEIGDNAEARVYLADVMTMTATATNVAEHARLVHEAAQKRKLAEIAEELGAGIYIGDNWASLADDAIEKIGKLSRRGRALPDAKADMLAWTRYYSQVKADPESAYCRTGYRSLDAALGGGMFNGDLYILAGRPGMGKTTQGIGIAERVAESGKPVLFASLEMPRVQILTKRIAQLAGISYSQALGGRLSDADERAALRATSDMSERPFYSVDDAYTVQDIEECARSVPELSLIVVDYLGLIQTGERPAPRYEEITRISGALKAMAKRLNKPILVLAQLNRENTTRNDKRPTMSDLRDSGAIEQDAGAVILLHRESYYKTDEEPPEVEEIELIIAKNRHASPGTVRMMWRGRTGEITERPNISMPF